MDVLKIFVAVARRGSFAAAARDANIDPSLISRSIAGLEAEIGVRLFQRSTRQMALTEAGTKYLGRIEAVIEELETAREEALSLSTSPRGVLRVTSSVAFGHACILPLLSKFRIKFPEIDLELILTDENLDLVADRIDLAIRLSPSIQSDVICSKLFDTCYRVVASPNYIAASSPIVRPADLANHNVLLHSLPDYRSRWIFQKPGENSIEVAVQGSITISNALGIRESMLDDMGPAMLANWLVDDYIANGSCVDIFPELRCAATEFETAAWFLYPSRNYLPNKVRVSLDFFKKEMQK